MHIEQTKTVDDLVNHIQTMPDNMQLEVFHFVDFLRMRNDVAIDTINYPQVKEPSELQKRFLQWREQYVASIAQLDDGWTDADHDALWNSVRDSDDAGRDMIFGE